MDRDFTIAGQYFRIFDLPALNDVFLSLYTAYFGNQLFDWTDFEKKAIAFFDMVEADSTISDKAGIHDRFFTNFEIVWRKYLSSGRLDEAERIWSLALQPALAWESEHQGKFIHKGTPFYFWGMTAILKGDLDRGYSLMHQSLQEDVRTQKKKYPLTPGFMLATVDDEKTNQAFRQWVHLKADFLSQRLGDYCKSHSHQLSLKDFRQRFLQNPPDMDTVFLFSYTVGRLVYLAEIPDFTLKNGFSSQLELNLLFDISVVIDEAIRGKHRPGRYYSKRLEYMSQKAGLNLHRPKKSPLIREVSRRFEGDFDKTLKEILERRFVFSNSTTLAPLEADLAISLGVRNYSAHNITSAPTVWKEFSAIQQSIFNVLFFTVETLY